MQYTLQGNDLNLQWDKKREKLVTILLQILEKGKEALTTKMGHEPTLESTGSGNFGPNTVSPPPLPQPLILSIVVMVNDSLYTINHDYILYILYDYIYYTLK